MYEINVNPVCRLFHLALMTCHQAKVLHLVRFVGWSSLKINLESEHRQLLQVTSQHNSDNVLNFAILRGKCSKLNEIRFIQIRLAIKTSQVYSSRAGVYLFYNGCIKKKVIQLWHVIVR